MYARWLYKLKGNNVIFLFFVVITLLNYMLVSQETRLERCLDIYNLEEIPIVKFYSSTDLISEIFKLTFYICTRIIEK